MIPSESLVASRIAKGVLIKTFFEIALVCVLVASAAYSNLHPRVRGVIDSVAPDRIAGWAHDADSHQDTVEVHLYIDNSFIASQLANRERVDLVAAGASARPNHGFSFVLPDLASGWHTVQVYALRPTFGRGQVLLPLARNAISLRIE